MTEIQIEQTLQFLIITYGWKLLVLLVGLMCMTMIREFVKNLAAGISVFLGNDINEDDIVYLKGRKARISRKGFRKTIFIMLDVDPRRKMMVFNHRLPDMDIEKTLPQNGNSRGSN